MYHSFAWDKTNKYFWVSSPGFGSSGYNFDAPTWFYDINLDRTYFADCSPY